MNEGYPIHESETGFFQELARWDDVDFKQLSLLSINPDCSRGGHYHSYKREWFCCVVGEGVLELRNVNTGEEESISLSISDRRFIEVNPYWRHTVVNESGMFPLIVLIIIDEEFDPENPDTYQIN